MTAVRSLAGRRWPLVALGALLLVLVGALGSLAVPGTAAPRTATTSVPVASTALVCPAPLASAGVVTTSITAAVAQVDGLPPGSSGMPNAARVATLGGSGGPIQRMDAVGSTAATAATTVSLPPVLVAGTGALAPGLAADQVTRGSNGRFRGLAALRCGPPVTDAWFVGGGSTVGRLTQLLLSNVDDQPAQVDVLVYGPHGPVDVPSARGLLVPPRSRTVLSLTSLAPGLGSAAVHVVARAGRVSPAMLDNQVRGLTPEGLEYVPPTQPGRDVTIPGVTGGTGSRLLTLVAPDQDATVAVRVVTPDGTITPTGMDAVAVPAGKTVSLELSQALEEADSAVRVVADQPVVAGIRQQYPGILTESSDVAGAVPLTGPAVVTGLGPTQYNTLRLAAPDGSAQVRVRVYRAGSNAPVLDSTYDVGSGTSASVRPLVSTTGWQWWIVEPVPGGGPVYVTRVTAETGSRGLLVTAAPVVPLRTTATLPAAEPLVGLAG